MTWRKALPGLAAEDYDGLSYVYGHNAVVLPRKAKVLGFRPPHPDELFLVAGVQHCTPAFVVMKAARLYHPVSHRLVLKITNE